VRILALLRPIPIPLVASSSSEFSDLVNVSNRSFYFSAVIPGPES